MLLHGLDPNRSLMLKAFLWEPCLHQVLYPVSFQQMLRGLPSGLMGPIDLQQELRSFPTFVQEKLPVVIFHRWATSQYL